MIYIENKDGVQRVVIPANDTNVEYVNFVPQEGDSDYYTKAQTDERIGQSRTAVLGEVGDWLSHYPTTDQMHDAIENVTVDLTGYATEDWVNEQGYATKQYVDDAVADIPTGGGGSADLSDYYTKGEVDTIEDGLQAQITDNHNSIIGLDSRVTNIETNGGGGIEPFIVEVDSIEPITKPDFDQLIESYSQGIPTYIRYNIGTTPRLIPVVGIQGNFTGALIGVAKMWVIDGNNLIEYTRSILGSNITYTTIPLGGSGGDSGVRVYEGTHVLIDGQGSYQFTNQMVYDMYKDYSNGLRVQVLMNGLYNVYFADETYSFYTVYILAGNLIGKLEGDINLPSEYTTFSECILVTDEIFNKAIPHKYEYTITDDFSFEGFFSEGEGYELFNDVKNGVDFNFKLITNVGQRRLILSSYDYDSQMNRANFWFLDMGGYVISCTMEYDGSMTISRIER